MATLTNQLSSLNKRVVALENTELSSSEAVPFIKKLYASFTTQKPIKCSTNTKVSENLILTSGANGAAIELASKINYAAVGDGAVPAPGDIGVADEVERKPAGSATTVESSQLKSIIVVNTYFDEQSANGISLSSASILYDATESAGTGRVIASEAIAIDKTPAKTLTISAEITVTEV